MKTGLVLEGGAMRGLKNIFEQMELLRATSAMPFVSELIEIDDKKYLDGGISDSIPV